ncbi:MAG: 3-methyl-2-oxobutanoate hydroxymethyltransferase [Methylacidiphilales bacterium]|nr:3-methyl-2-oxobutanoate hydroxymethyltransferase [Candidatus Methylacidiphilales bacterium]
MDKQPKITPDWIRGAKARGEKIAALTAYDYPTARLLDEAGVPLILVGDSVGMVVLGYPDTTQVTLAEMRHHVLAVARAKPQALVVADLPYHTYETVQDAVDHARVLTEAGAEAIKLEGGVEVVPEIKALRRAGVPVMGHIGMLPQHVREEGGYKMKGKSDPEKERLLQDARAIEQAGAFALVVELVEPEFAREITAAVNIPTIGIGSGDHCAGKIMVTHDLVGAFPWFRPKFALAKADVGSIIRKAAEDYVRQVKQTAN